MGKAKKAIYETEPAPSPPAAGADDLIDAFRGDHAFLSNFYEHPVEVEGAVYPTAEHAFQAMKTLDPAERETVRAAATPAAAKRLGKKVTLRPDWDTYRFDVMERVLRAKFGDAELGRRLAETGDRYLVEGNTWRDTTWGAVRGRDGAWRGQNHLGKTLMRVRESSRPFYQPGSDAGETPAEPEAPAGGGDST